MKDYWKDTVEDPNKGNIPRSWQSTLSRVIYKWNVMPTQAYNLSCRSKSRAVRTVLKKVTVRVWPGTQHLYRATVMKTTWSDIATDKPTKGTDCGAQKQTHAHSESGCHRGGIIGNKDNGELVRGQPGICTQKKNEYSLYLIPDNSKPQDSRLKCTKPTFKTSEKRIMTQE